MSALLILREFRRAFASDLEDEESDERPEHGLAQAASRQMVLAMPTRSKAGLSPEDRDQLIDALAHLLIETSAREVDDEQK